MDEKARKRLIFCWRNAKRLPMTIVAIAKITSIMYQVSNIGWKALYKALMKTKAIDPFEMTDRNEVAAIGEPSYTSAVHK